MANQNVKFDYHAGSFFIDHPKHGEIKLKEKEFNNLKKEIARCVSIESKPLLE